MDFPLGLVLSFLILSHFGTARVLDDAFSLQKKPDSLDTKLNTELGNLNLERLPSGTSPGVGHMVVHAHTQRLQTEAKSSALPGVGHYSPSGHMEKIEDSESTQTFNKLPSGPSPGVGHSTTHGHVAVEAEAEAATIKLNKLPSGPSPGGGNSIPDGHVESIETTSQRKATSSYTLHKLPSGQSPGVGNDGEEIAEKKHKHIESINAGNVASSSIRPQSGGPSPGAGHGFENDNTKKSAENVALGSIKAWSSGATHSSEDTRIGCAMEGGSGNIKLFEGSSFYGTPTSTLFDLAGIDSPS